MFLYKHPAVGCSIAACTLWVTLLLCCMPGKAFTQFANDTIILKPKAAEQIFLQQNIPLLAGRLNIDQADAKILQAKSWPNPSLEINDIQLYNKPETDASPGLMGTDFWRNRTFGAQLEQLVQLAGKRKKNIVFETRNKELAQVAFTDLLLSLKAEFRQAIAELAYLQHVSGDLKFQYQLIKELALAHEKQHAAGNISQSQLYRIKALQINIQAEMNEIAEQVTNKQQSLKSLMALSPAQYLIIDDSENAQPVLSADKYNIQQLLELSAQHNTAIKIANQEKRVSEATLAIEKANAVPDLNLSLNYDRNGNNQLDFVGAGVAIDLPFFNRNRGNIKAAQYEVQKMELLEKNKTTTISNSIVKVWQDLHQSMTLFESFDKDYLTSINNMTTAISDNFSKRNISLLEFLDFFESFKESKERYYQSIKNIALKKEDLQYLIGQDL